MGTCLQGRKEWFDGNLIGIISFSALVFISGTRFFIEPPEVPGPSTEHYLLIKAAFIMERVLGALFSIMFFIAISGTIVRAA